MVFHSLNFFSVALPHFHAAITPPYKTLSMSFLDLNQKRAVTKTGSFTKQTLCYPAWLPAPWCLPEHALCRVAFDHGNAAYTDSLWRALFHYMQIINRIRSKWQIQ